MTIAAGEAGQEIALIQPRPVLAVLLESGRTVAGCRLF
jgi:hypothetical protein